MKWIAAADNYDGTFLPDEYFLGGYLERALGDISNPNWQTVNENRKLLEWFKSPVEDGVTTFRGIVMILGFRPSTIQKIMNRIAESELKINEILSSLKWIKLSWDAIQVRKGGSL